MLEIIYVTITVLFSSRIANKHLIIKFVTVC